MKKNSTINRVTMKDVAERAGVSIAIVSRVINKDPTLNIKSETRQSVIDAVNDMNYVPNLRARGLRTQKTYVIGVVITDIMNPFYTEVVKGIQNAADKAGYAVLLFDTGDDMKKERNIIDFVQSQCVDGIILGSIYYGDEIIGILDNTDMKYVMMNRVSSLSKAPYVRTDDIAGMSMIVDYLAGLGHKKIAYLSGPLYADTALKRMEGYRKALLKNDIEYNSKYIRETNFDVETGEACCMDILRACNDDDMPTAICAGNDMVAIGAMNALKKSGYSVPEDFSVTGYNNIWISGILTPALTTINTPQQAMGRKTFEILQGIIDGTQDNSYRLTIQPDIIVRASTAPPRK
jgi:Transcriptional regulators